MATHLGKVSFLLATTKNLEDSGSTTNQSIQIYLYYIHIICILYLSICLTYLFSYLSNYLSLGKVGLLLALQELGGVEEQPAVRVHHAAGRPLQLSKLSDVSGRIDENR